MTIIKDAIDLGASDEERYRHLRRIIENVLGDTDPGDANTDRRRWLTWIFLYVLWHEGDSCRTRTQRGGGPGRGLMQFEPRTLHWLVANYILGPTPGLIANLAAAAGVTLDEMREALRAFKDSPDPGTNVWPNPANDAPAKKLERWLLEIDSFGVKLMRYVFRAHGAQHRFPPRAQGDLTADPQEERFKSEHAEHWGLWWKRSFPSDEERERILENFKERARLLDETARRAASSAPPPAPTPQPPQPPPTPVPPAPRGECPFVLAMATDAEGLAALRRLRTGLLARRGGPAVVTGYHAVRPSIVRSIQSSALAMAAWSTAARIMSRCAMGRPQLHLIASNQRPAVR